MAAGKKYKTNKMKKWFWCLFKHTNYKVNENLNSLIYKCIWLIENCPNAVVSIDYYTISITTSSSKIELWNANKFYAWLSQGTVNGRRFKDISASKSAMYDFKKFLENRGFNINPEQEEQKLEINLEDIKC